MNSMVKQFKALEFTYDESRELWVIRYRDTKEIVINFEPSEHHKSGWCVKSDDELRAWKQCTREHFQELKDLTGYGIDVLQAWSRTHESKAV